MPAVSFGQDLASEHVGELVAEIAAFDGGGVLKQSVNVFGEAVLGMGFPTRFRGKSGGYGEQTSEDLNRHGRKCVSTEEAP